MADEKKRDSYHPPVMNEKRGVSPIPSSKTTTDIANHPALPIVSYCFSSILMTVTNKYVLSGLNFNLNFFLLCIQNSVCILAISGSKAGGFITFRDFKTDEARKWFPISLLLIGMIYTGSKAIQFLSIPVYTIFKNLTIILIAYGEVLWFGGHVSGMILASFGLMVLSSVIAAWADIEAALGSYSYGGSASASTSTKSLEASEKISTLNAGYLWMLFNCVCSASYMLGVRKRIKLTNFKDFDTMYYNNLLTIPILLVLSLVLESWTPENLAVNFPPGSRDKIITAMVISGLSSVFISYTSAWCIRVTSSTTYSMVGALNKLPIAISGLVFFDAPVTFASISAIGVGFVSGIVYAIGKIHQSAAAKRTTVLPTSSAPMMSASSASMRDGFKS